MPPPFFTNAICAWKLHIGELWN